MGLTSDSTGKKIVYNEKFVKKKDEFLVALAGNPNVGKSTVFNALTGMKQHTGNWAGKTVSNAIGHCEFENKKYILADIPGTYSLMAQSAEEEAARDFICFENPNAVIVVCDATCIERNLNLVLQILEITSNVVVCVNLMDEAEKKNMHIDINLLSNILGTPVVGVTARSGKGLDDLMRSVGDIIQNQENNSFSPVYEKIIEDEAEKISDAVKPLLNENIPLRWTAMQLLQNNEKIIKKISEYANCNISEEIFGTLNKTAERLARNNWNSQKISDSIVSAIVKSAEEITKKILTYENVKETRDRKIDKILTSRIFGIPIMIGILGVVFWLTAVGANYPSELLSRGLFYLGERLYDFLNYVGCHTIVRDMAVNGVYRVLAWVASVMLPPMAGYKINRIKKISPINYYYYKACTS